VTSASLLVELNTEELPPRALRALSEAFAAGIADGLRERGFLGATALITPYGAPRRLAVHITEVATRAPDKVHKERLMPVAVALDADGQPTAALQKKLAAKRLTHLEIDSLKREHDGKQDVLVYQDVVRGGTLAVGLQGAIEEAIDALPIPKMMSYQLADGETTVHFVRPAHRLVALHGTDVVGVHALGLDAGRETFGHRFHGAGALSITSADRYAQQLADDGRVIASFAERRARIVALLDETGAKLGAQVVAPDDLLDEVTALVEWPIVYASEFGAEFLAVPHECLILTMQQNQRYFALQDAAGDLMNRFLLVSHLEASDGGQAIAAGNARVVRARLADAKFFFDQDRKATLESRVPGLAQVVYHQKLGSQLERVERITGIAVGLARMLDADVTHVERAARLAKADLRTLMVGEFPELQGVMGAYYARHDGEPGDVVAAIREHYLPRHAGDRLPASKVGTCVALADKLEALIGLFGVGEKPTGERDPYALRRHALGVLRIWMDNALPLELDAVLATASGEFAAMPAYRSPGSELTDFIYERLRGLLRESGYTAHEIEAVVAPRPQRIDRVPRQLAAVRAFMALPEAESLAAANKRIGNILKKADIVPASFDRALFQEPAEQSLGDAYTALQPSAERLFAGGDYTGMLRALAPLKSPVDRFFDEVMVNVDDPRLRANRLGLLAALQATMNRVADISKLTA
jgi:glycyl-tRNA synthetase beta chain